MKTESDFQYGARNVNASEWMDNYQIKQSVFDVEDGEEPTRGGIQPYLLDADGEVGGIKLEEEVKILSPIRVIKPSKAKPRT